MVAVKNKSIFSFFSRFFWLLEKKLVLEFWPGGSSWLAQAGWLTLAGSSWLAGWPCLAVAGSAWLKLALAGSSCLALPGCVWFWTCSSCP